MNLTIIFIIFAVLVAFAFISKELLGDKDKKSAKKPYTYKKKDYFMTRSEHAFFDTLMEHFGNEYVVFAQAHLPTIVDHKIRNGQSRTGALAHINRKSVDFVLCDKTSVSPKLAIELDDPSHERPDRKERDHEVERILHDAGLPLLRIKSDSYSNPSELAQQINTALAA